MLTDLAELDPDDPRTPSQQIANALRAGILRGIFPAGEKLPSQHELVQRYGVARETVKSALRILDREGLIVSRQGAGSFVRTRRGDHLDLQGLLRTAFDRPDVTIDYAGFNGETLSKTLLPSLHELGRGTLTARSLQVRLLLVDPASLKDFPRRVDGKPNDRALRAVFAGILRQSVTTVAGVIRELTDATLLRSGSVTVRTHGLGPVVKCYILNGERALLGFYPVTNHSITLRGEQVELLHPSGWDAVLTTSDGPASGPPFPEQAGAWFSSVWDGIAKPL